ncbi:hypothetical protein [Paenarthrobacter sp. NPDC018779]|uniref:hypothetical protein n=1 Tax=Paenarthrobacter sp. NPDC018779 TaxID=3364375 RepID=UPI0037C57B6F
MSLYELIDADDLVLVAPDGYKLAVMQIPFAPKFAITWWVDANGKMGKSERKA